MRIAVMLSCLLLTSCSGDGVGVAFDTDAQSAEVQQDCSLWPEATVDAMIQRRQVRPRHRGRQARS